MKKIIILIPIFNDWNSLYKLIFKINSEISDSKFEFSIIIVNDASTENRKEISFNCENLKSIKIINMRHNIGQSRCNASGLKFIFENEEFDYVLPMDGDGEDRPEEIKNFLKNSDNLVDKPIVGERVERSEGKIFKICYMIHKILTLILTGKSIKFGHFTLLPRKIVNQLINEKATWSNFSGSLTKILKTKISIPSIRGKRYFDKSKMSYFNLILHSLSIMSVFKINLFFRFLVLIAFYIYFIYQNISIITLIPIFFVIIFIFLIILMSRRESLEKLNSSLRNITSIEKIE